MKNILFSLALLFSTAHLSAQYAEIIYDESKNFPSNKTVTAFSLRLNTKTSYYLELTNTFDAAGQIVELGTDYKQLYVKDYNTRQLTYFAPIFTRKQIVQESLPLQQWELEPETRLIGGYLCRKATTQFRGREYIAWYTEAIPLLGGPWKFDGLPGLILEVSSADGVYKIQARSVTLKTGQPDPPTAAKELTEAKAVTWTNYCDEFQQAVKRWQKAMAAKADPEMEYSLALYMIEDIGLKSRSVTTN